MKKTAEQLQALSVYVPPSVTRLVFSDPKWQPGGSYPHFHAATVFADISGFTPLAEKLSAIGVRGAEELTVILNNVFEALITAAERHGGWVVKFGGDAISLIWRCPEERLPEFTSRAVQAAFAMQAAMAAFSVVSTSQGQFQLRMKIGLSAGKLLEVNAGGVFGRWEYVLAGSPMAGMSAAEHHATAGEIILDPVAWDLLAKANPPATTADAPPLRGEEVEDGFYRVTQPGRGWPPRTLITPDWTALEPEAIGRSITTLQSYIPGAIRSLLESGHKVMLGELKRMTICFLGFDGLDYVADPQAGLRLSDFMRDAQEVIYRYEGSVNKLAVGDKGNVLLILFGAPPFFHEDDEVRAVACAMGLCKVAARHKFTGRVGIAAGPIFAGPLGAPQRREYTVIGDTVNLSARLMQKAGPGEVWVDQTVQAQAYRFFEFADLGAMQVKGKNEPRRLYRADREKEQEDAEPPQVEVALTGRARELEYFDALGAKVREGRGQVLLIVGEAGVGKSRLATEIVRRWVDGVGRTHNGTCVSHGRHTPYLPWRGILTSIAELVPSLSVEQRVARLEAVLRKLPLPQSTSDVTLSEDYWVDRLPLLANIMGLECKDSPLTRNLSEGLKRDNAFAALKALVLEEARRAPLLLLLEDTHSSDELSMELTAFLAAAISNAAIFLVLVHRPVSKPIPLPYERLRAMPYARQLVVTELDPEASLQLAKNKLGVAELPADLAALIRRKGQGNPFFIEELLNSLMGMQALKVENGRCVMAGDFATLELPDTVQKVVLARIDRLKDEEKMTLKVAAAIGRTFQRDLVEKVHPWLSSADALTHQLAHLQAEDFTREETRDSDPEFLFKHIITQEVAYETMLFSQRQQLHGTLGDVLETRTNNREIIDLLAYHYSRSDNRQKAMSYLCRAGEKALTGYANAAAVSYFTESLKIAEKLGNVPIQLDSLAGRERAYNRMGNRAGQRDDLTRMKTLASQHGAMDQFLEAGNRQVQLGMNVGDYTGALATGEETLELARREGKPLWEVRVLTNMGITYWRQGQYDNARSCMLKALESQGAAEDPRLKAVSLNYLGLIRVQISEYEQARDDYQQALEIYRALSDKIGEAGCANNIGLLESSLGNYPEAQQAYTQAYSLCHTIGDRLLEGISLNLLGQVCTILGNFALGKEHLEHSLSIRRAIGDRRGEAFCLHDLGHLYLDTDAAEKAIAMFTTATEIRRSLGESGNHVASLAAKGTAHSRQGEHDAARQCLQEAVNALEKGSGSGEYPVQNVWWSYAQLCQAQGQAEAARAAVERAYRQVKAKADQIRTPTLRRSYLENVRTNAAIVKAMETAPVAG